MKRAITLALTLGALAPGCSDDTKKGGTDTTKADTTEADTTAPEDVDAADDSGPDVAPDVVADTAPAPFSPQANIYRVDPVTTPNTEQVELEHLTSDDHTLTGQYANVRSCTPDTDRGTKIPLDLGGFHLDITACVPEHKALPGDDGTYLGITPPATPADDDGRFAEVQMYHHMQVIHDYYHDVHGLTNRDAPLDALTNVQAYVCNAWSMIANAAFVPKGGFDIFGVDLGTALGLNDDAIIFSGTPTKNFAYDGVVIYHEYTHSILGATRLNAAFIDDQGLNNLPGALNEAYADYFAGTVTDQSGIGNYALNDMGDMSLCGFPVTQGGNFSRDMSTVKTCPSDLTAEAHADSEIFSSALWQIHEDLGNVDADKVVLQAVLTLNNTSDFTLAAEATIDAADALFGADAKAKVEKAFTDRGLVDCKRVLPIDRVGARGLAVSFEGTDTIGDQNPFPGYVPGYVQYSFVVPEGTKTVTLAFDVQAGGLGSVLGGGGGGGPDLDAVFKPGDAPIRYTLGFTVGSGKNDGVFSLPVTNGKVVIESGGDHPPTAGTWTFALHNKGGAGALAKVTATFE